VNLNEIYKFLTQVVPKCGNLIRDKFYTEKDITAKTSFADFVTETDIAVEKFFKTAISEKYPSHSFIGEESTSEHEKVKFTDEPVWIIDPIDGTTNFVHSFPNCAISIGFYINKQAQIGVVYNPILDLLYSAIRGQGAYLNGRAIKSSGVKELARAQIITEFGNTRKPEMMDTVVGNMRRIIEKAHSIRCTGSAAMNLCSVASGGGDVYFEMGPHIWDFAAGALIASEAGCVLMDVTGGPFDLLSRHVLCASTPELAAQIIPLIQPIVYETD